jgi:hypothetical protein
MALKWSKHVQDKTVYNDMTLLLIKCILSDMSNAQKILTFFNVWLGGSLRSGLTNKKANDNQEKAHGMIHLKA